MRALFGGSEVEPRDSRYEGASTLGGMLYNMPTQAGANTAWQNYFSGVKQNQFNRALFGGGATSEDVEYYNAATGQWDTQTVNSAATPGLIKTYGQMAGSFSGQNQTADQYGDGIMAELQRQAMRELQNPYALSSGEGREVIQQSLSNPAMSSFGMQPLYAYATASNLGTRAREAAAGRRQFASGVAGQGYQQYTAPGLNMAGSLFGSAMNDSMNADPDLIDPYGEYGMDLNNTNFNAAAAAKISDANRYADAAAPD